MLPEAKKFLDHLWKITLKIFGYCTFGNKYYINIYIFDSHSRNNCGMPCANGTSILMKFDDIVNAVSYICELAHALSASLFHWTFCHALPDTQCECRISVPQMGVLLEEDIMKLYSEFIPLISQQNKQNKRNYYAPYRKRV